MEASYSTFYNNFISLTGDKLQACLKVTECPPNTTVKMAQDSKINQTVLACLNTADVVLACPSAFDSEDFGSTRLSSILSLLIRKKVIVMDCKT
jgi:hypothetical protein